jgi:NAD(P)-dependent dehydrogenase (short-subunit alcohol dehydrogenase family)
MAADLLGVDPLATVAIEDSPTGAASAESAGCVVVVVPNHVKVLITGSARGIGKLLVRGLAHEVTEFDLPECDARSLEQLTDAATGHDALVHLAWDTASENYDTDSIDFDNTLMAFNAYRASERTSVRRVVMASSVAADVMHGRRRHVHHAGARRLQACDELGLGSHGVCHAGLRPDVFAVTETLQGGRSYCEVGAVGEVFRRALRFVRGVPKHG